MRCHYQSAGRQPRVDRELRAGQESCAVGAEEDDGLGDVFGFDAGHRAARRARARASDWCGAGMNPDGI